MIVKDEVGKKKLKKILIKSHLEQPFWEQTNKYKL